MGKTRRLVKKGKSKGRKSIRNKKGKKSIRRRKSYKKMRGGVGHDRIIDFVEGYVKSGLSADAYVKKNMQNVEHLFEDRNDFLEELDDIRNDKAIEIKEAFIAECNENDGYTTLCFDSLPSQTSNRVNTRISVLKRKLFNQ